MAVFNPPLPLKSHKKPGAQPGHKHHGRKKQTPTEPTVTLMPPQEILDDPEFKPTGTFITKQLVSSSLNVQIQEYQAEIYRNSKTGERIHGTFPDGVGKVRTYSLTQPQMEKSIIQPVPRKGMQVLKELRQKTIREFWCMIMN